MSAPLEPTATGSGTTYTFIPLDKAFPSLEAADAKDSLRKWNLDAFQVAKAWRFDQPFSPEQADAFLLDFFSSPSVQGAAPVCVGPGGAGGAGKPACWSELGTVQPGAIKYTRLAATVLRLDFFDRLKDAGIVRGGEVSKCLDVQCGEVLVSDRLRTMLLDESSEDWEVFSERERSELIFHVLRRLAIGGGMNQWDDAMEPYLNLTRSIYKDLVSVHKTGTGALQVSSFTYLVTEVNGSSASLFSRPSEHNFCYITIDPTARHVKLWYSAWFPMM